MEFPGVGCRGAHVLPVAARQHQEVLDWLRQQTGAGLRSTRIGIWIRIAGRTMSSTLFRRQPWKKRARPS